MRVAVAVKQSVDWFIPVEYHQEEFQQYRARIVVSFSLFLAMWGPLFAAVYFFTSSSAWEPLGGLAATLMLAQVPFTLRYTRSLALAGNCFILNVFLLVCYLSYAAGGLGAPPLAWNTALPMFAIAIVGYRYGLLWAAITLFTFSAFYGYEQLGYRVARHVSVAQSQTMNFVGLCGMLLLILSMTMLYESHQNQSARILKLANDKLAETSCHLRAIVDNAADGILTFDTSGTVRSFNPAAERLFGYKAADVIGQSLKRLMPLPSSS
jgi:PAS domain-containing protein